MRQLRFATAAQHRELDGALNTTGPAFDAWAYRRLLEGFYGLHVTWEPRAVAQFASVLPGFYERRRKLPLLHQDLLSLGASADEIAALPVCVELAEPTTFSTTLGTAYVLEGSTLGGHLLSRQFHNALGVRPERGGAYFHGYGENTGGMWREFGQMLESFATLTAIHDEVLKGAKETFAIVHRWLLERDE